MFKPRSRTRGKILKQRAEMRLNPSGMPFNSRAQPRTNINGARVALNLKRKDSQTELTISARKYMFPKLDIAGGVLYQIAEKL
jgi:hypothetical protein